MTDDAVLILGAAAADEEYFDPDDSWIRLWMYEGATSSCKW